MPLISMQVKEYPNIKSSMQSLGFELAEGFYGLNDFTEVYQKKDNHNSRIKYNGKQGKITLSINPRNEDLEQKIKDSLLPVFKSIEKEQ